MKKLIGSYLIFGATWGCVIFVMTFILADFMSDGALVIDNFTANAVGAMVTGAAFCVSSLVYKIDSIVLWLKVVINVLVGFGVFLPIAFGLGWISIESPSGIIIFVAIVVILFVAIAFGDYLINGRDAKKINAKLRKQDVE